MTITEANSENWNDLTIAADKPVISMFYMVSCPACNKMKPLFEDLSNKFGDRINFIQIEAMDNYDITEKYGILAAPSFKFFKNGGQDKSIDIDLLRGDDFSEAVSSWIEKSV
ncbi:MAG: thioredoxin family protein [Methanosarcinaceae archaeon]|nr:thioredoxin family protein [Methanosarcinaceae archaeon]